MIGYSIAAAMESAIIAASTVIIAIAHDGNGIISTRCKNEICGIFWDKFNGKFFDSWGKILSFKNIKMYNKLGAQVLLN